MRFLLPALLFFVLVLPAGADPTAKTVPPAPKKLTLAQALAAAPPPADGLLLTVSAEQVTLPNGMEPSAADASAGNIAAAFGDQTVRFGSVTAIAPQTMVLLNTQPDVPNIMTDMSYLTVLKMLAASLEDTQWQALTSERGLGLSDLTDDTQRGLFHALFPHGELWIASDDPALQNLPESQRTDVREVTDQIDTTRLRLGQTANIYLHDRRGKTLYFGRERLDGAIHLHTYHHQLPPLTAEHGVSLKAEVPNTLKASELDYDSPVLQAAVPLPGLKTVGDLVARISLQTKSELYADPHYAARTMQVIGAAKAASAGDLLRALCVCVTGTFRKVGTAYVLTDDLAGVGTRRKVLQDWQDAAIGASGKLDRQAGSIMLERRASSARNLPSFGDPLAMTPEEMAAVPDMPGQPGVPSEEDAYPLAKLTPTQQEWARQTAAEFDEQLHSSSLPFYLKGDDLAEADLTKNVDLGVNYKLQLLVPSAPMPVETNLQEDVWLLYYEGDTAQARQEYDSELAKAQAKLPPAPPLSAALRSGRCRAVLSHPRTAKDVDALVAAMQKLGLNALLLDVFSSGVNHIKTSAVNGTDILTEALARTRGTGVAVYADLSLLPWGNAPPDAVQDLTIEGQNTRNAAIQAHQLNPSTDYDHSTDKPLPFTAPSVSVSPSSPQVQTALAALVRDVAAQSGLTGFVWENAAVDSDLGYTLDRRLAFLRSVHADPVDLTDTDALQARTKLPLFDDAKITAAVNALWTKAQVQVNMNLLEQLRIAAQAGGALPILMEQGWDAHLWYASWDDPKSQPPPQRELSFDRGYAANEAAVKRIARAQSHLVLRREVIENDGDTAAIARKLQDDAKILPGDGFVLDFRHEEVTQGAAPLAALVQAVSEEGSKVSGKTAQKTVK